MEKVSELGQNVVKILQFFTCWIRIRIPNPDPDPGGDLNPDPTGSGSKTLVSTIGTYIGLTLN